MKINLRSVMKKISNHLLERKLPGWSYPMSGLYVLNFRYKPWQSARSSSPLTKTKLLPVSQFIKSESCVLFWTFICSCHWCTVEPRSNFLHRCQSPASKC